MKLTIQMKQKLERKIKKELEMVLLIKINAIICNDDSRQYRLVLSSDFDKSVILYRSIDQNLCETISKASGLDWELQGKAIYLKGGYIILFDEINGDLLEQKWKWDGDEFDFEGIYQNRKEVNCSSYDPDCPCPVHSWEPDIKDFTFKREKEVI